VVNRAANKVVNKAVSKPSRLIVQDRRSIKWNPANLVKSIIKTGNRMLQDPPIRKTLPVNRTRILTVQINKRLPAYVPGLLVPASKNRYGGFFVLRTLRSRLGPVHT